ncbi:MAG: hypothetical protein AAF483_12295 [Planctomycetota bacterium]
MTGDVAVPTGRLEERIRKELEPPPQPLPEKRPFFRMLQLFTFVAFFFVLPVLGIYYFCLLILPDIEFKLPPPIATDTAPRVAEEMQTALGVLIAGGYFLLALSPLVFPPMQKARREQLYFPASYSSQIRSQLNMYNAVLLLCSVLIGVIAIGVLIHNARPIMVLSTWMWQMTSLLLILRLGHWFVQYIGKRRKWLELLFGLTIGACFIALFNIEDIRAVNIVFPGISWFVTLPLVLDWIAGKYLALLFAILAAAIAWWPWRNSWSFQAFLSPSKSSLFKMSRAWRGLPEQASIVFGQLLYPKSDPKTISQTQTPSQSQPISQTLEGSIREVLGNSGKNFGNYSLRFQRGLAMAITAIFIALMTASNALQYSVIGGSREFHFAYPIWIVHVASIYSAYCASQAISVGLAPARIMRLSLKGIGFDLAMGLVLCAPSCALMTWLSGHPVPVALHVLICLAIGCVARFLAVYGMTKRNEEMNLFASLFSPFITGWLMAGLGAALNFVFPAFDPWLMLVPFLVWNSFLWIVGWDRIAKYAAPRVDRFAETLSDWWHRFRYLKSGS